MTSLQHFEEQKFLGPLALAVVALVASAGSRRSAALN